MTPIERLEAKSATVKGTQALEEITLAGRVIEQDQYVDCEDDHHVQTQQRVILSGAGLSDRGLDSLTIASAARHGARMGDITIQRFYRNAEPITIKLSADEMTLLLNLFITHQVAPTIADEVDRTIVPTK